MNAGRMLREVTVDSGGAMNPELHRLYESAFPAEEQIPYADLVGLMPSMPIVYSAWYDGDVFVGLTIVCEWPAASWFWYFAVREDMRGRGYGSQILKAVMERYKERPLVLDIESPRQECGNQMQRRRRYEFYLRSGLADTGIERAFSGVSYAILATAGCQFTEAGYDSLLDHLRSCWEAMPARD